MVQVSDFKNRNESVLEYAVGRGQFDLAVKALVGTPTLRVTESKSFHLQTRGGSGDSSNSCVPPTHVRDPDGVSGSLPALS